MTTLIITLLLSGIIAGLIQYFVDFKGLPIYTPANTNEGMYISNAPDFWSRMLNFFKRNWQFFGYIVVGIAGAFLVPVIDQLLHLKGVDEYLKCLNNSAAETCKNKEWNLLIIFGYGIISGYSSVRIIRGFGAFIVGNIGKSLEEQKEILKKTREELEALKKKLLNSGLPESVEFQPADITEGTLEYPHFCDAEDAVDILEGVSINSACEQFPRPWAGKKWRVAGSLKQLLNEVNVLAPARNKKSDGTIGDIAHSQGNSDHNPWVKDSGGTMGIVTALDITHDSKNGCDCNVIAQFLQDKKDKRVKYVIWNRRIMNASAINGSAAWAWRPYTGQNPHDKHIHISVQCDKLYCDDNQKWNVKTV